MELRCHKCAKLLGIFQTPSPLRRRPRATAARSDPTLDLEIRCPRCKAANIFTCHLSLEETGKGLLAPGQIEHRLQLVTAGNEP